MLDRVFHLGAAGTSVRTELIAGLTTFVTMAYIAVVNASILSGAGMDFGAVFVATCLAAAIGSAAMGLLANHPIALAPGMGLNAWFAFAVVGGMGFSWQEALGAVFASGIIFVVLSILPIRAWLIQAIPQSLKLAVAAGIGLFLGLLGLKNAGLVQAHPQTFVTMTDTLGAWEGLALGGFVLIIALSARKVPGAILLGMLATAAAGVGLGVSTFHGVFAPPPSIAPTFAQLDLGPVLAGSMWGVVFAFVFVDLFDTAGTLVAVAHRGGLLDSRGHLPRLGRALLADSGATVAGAVLGTSTTTSYIESAAGIDAGGRTGLTAVTVAACFVAFVFLEPLARSVPEFATAPALLFVAAMMTQALSELRWDDPTEVAPAIVTALAIPFTFSIAHGIGLGFVIFAGAKLLAGRFRELPPAVVVVALLFLAKWVWL